MEFHAFYLLFSTNNTQDTFNNLVAKSGKRLDPGSREALYEEFKAQKAMKDLEKELDNLNK